MNASSRIVNPSEADAAVRLREMIMGFRVTQMLYVAARLSLADHVAALPRSAEQLAAITGAEPSALRRLLRALTSLGIFTETDGSFALTALGQPLRRDAARSLSGLALLYGEEWLWSVYGRTLHSVRTGDPAFATVHGMPFYAFLDTHEEPAAQFHAAMSAYSRVEAAAIVDACPLPPRATVVDVGGGDGTLLALLLRAHPSLRGVLFDQPAVVAGAERIFADAGVAARARLAGGDFFSDLPAGADVYLLKSVLHNWADPDAERILRCCGRAMAPGSRLLIVERIVAADGSPSEGALFDINMLVVAGGRERTEDEYRQLLERTGFLMKGVIPTQSPLSILDAERAATSC